MKWLSGSCPSGFNLKPHVQSLSEHLQTIGLPYDLKRKFRSLDEFKRWKASEKQTFFLHASLPVLKVVLHKNFMKFSNLVFLCSMDIVLLLSAPF